MDNKKYIFWIIISLLLFLSVLVICDTYEKVNNNKSNITIEYKLDSLKKIIESNKNSIVIYKDMMKNEIIQVDCLSNDSAITLFRELVNE